MSRPSMSDPEQRQALVARLRQSEWPEHALFGPMTGQDWGVSCDKHFDHHLRQFGC